MKLRAGLLGLVFLALSLAVVSSGSTLAQAETRVRASNFQVAVGVSDFGPSAAFSQLGNGQSYDGTASVPVLAAEGGGDAVTFAGRAPGFRQAVTEAVGAAPTDAVYQAHHVFPVQFGRDFAEIGIDVNKGEYGAWVEKGLHEGMSSEYAKDWEGFFSGNPTQSHAFGFARMLADKYGYDVNF